MKKFYMTALLAGITLSSFGQRAGVATPMDREVRVMGANGAEVNRDTLMHSQWNGTWSPVIYGVQGEGPGSFIFGTNGYGDKQKVQAFIPGDLHPAVDHLVEGAVLWFGRKVITSGNPASKIVVKVYQMNGTGDDLSGTVNIAPGTVLGSVDVLAANIDTNDFVYVSFPTPVGVTAGMDYGIGVDFSTLAAGDSAGIVSSTDQEYVVPESVWEQWSDNSWHTLPEGGWGGGTFDAVMAIWAAVDLDYVSVSEPNGVKMVKVFPNPATETTSFAFSTESAGNVSLEVYDITGKMVDLVNLGNRSAGANTYTYSVDHLTSGVYIYTLRNGENTVTGRLAVTK